MPEYMPYTMFRSAAPPAAEFSSCVWLSIESLRYCGQTITIMWSRDPGGRAAARISIVYGRNSFRQLFQPGHVVELRVFLVGNRLGWRSVVTRRTSENG